MTRHQYRRIRRDRAQRRALFLERLADLIGALSLFILPIAGLYLAWGML